MSDSDENIPYGRKFGSGFRGTRYDGTVADDVENTPIIPDDMYRRIALINLDIHLDRVKIERFHFCLPFMHIASACENQSSEDSGWLSPEIEINSLDKIPLGEYLQAGISKMKSTDWA